VQEFRITQPGVFLPDGSFVAGVVVLPGDSIILSGRSVFTEEDVAGVPGLPGYPSLPAGARGNVPYACRRVLLEQIGKSRAKPPIPVPVVVAAPLSAPADEGEDDGSFVAPPPSVFEVYPPPPRKRGRPRKGE
jgi:hypothetical protein